MNVKRLLLAFVVTMFAFSIQASAQDKVVTGKVTDDKGAAVSGVTIKLKNGKSLGSTNSDGTFSVKVPAGSTLSFSSVGFGAQDMQTPASGSMTVSLKASNDNLNEVVVIGYGSAKKKDLTGSVATVTSKDFVKGAITTPEQMIAGKVAGVSVVANDGTPGSGSVIRIRGGASMNASNDPLIVIDDVPLDNGGIKGSANALNLINPNDIESFTVLKDASAAAIYGSRASNGVIIIKTKKGKSGKPSFNFSTVTSLYTPAKYLDVMNADQFRNYVKANGSAKEIALLGNANTDWQREIYRNAIGFDNSISVSGTHKKMPYRASLGYLNQQGILDGGKLQRTSLSLNLSPKFFNEHLKVDVNLKGAATDQKFADGGAVGAATEYDPTQPVYSGSGRFGNHKEWLSGIDGLPFGTSNPVGLLKMVDNRSHVERFIGNIQFDYRLHFWKDVRINVNLGIDAAQGRESNRINDSARAAYRNFKDPVSGILKGGNMSDSRQRKTNTVMDIYANWVKETNMGRFDFTAGYSYQNFLTTNFSNYNYTWDGTRKELVDYQFLFDRPEQTLIGQYARLNYSYNSKYMFTASVRRDGSSRFDPSNRWGTFPSFAAAWRIKDDLFQKSNFVNDLKLRGGWGQTGQQDVGGFYEYLPRFTVGGNNSMYQFGSNFLNVFSPNAYYPRTWETTEMLNFGVDFALAKNRITGTFEYYNRKTKDMLALTNLPGGSNFTSQVVANVGDMKNEGLELTLNLAVIRKKDMTLDLSFNANYNKNTVTRLSQFENPQNPGNKFGGIGDVAGTPVAINSVGYARGSFWVFKQVYDKAGKPIEGVVEDLNRDGAINADKDQYRYKQIDPVMFYGFSPSFTYKKWSTGFTMRASYGNYLFNARNARTANMPSVLVNVNSGFLANTSTNVLETNFKNNRDESRLSNYYVENASFIRMDNFNIGYNFGKVFKNTANLRVGANVQNAFVITKYSGLDPEVFGGVDNTINARPRVFVLSLNLDF